ncbi:hypothetical protein FRC15_005714 [Serendipita sp. 397]|nr:hypothetical protein FRC15_005714 [Serendipita sp. 397]
MVLILPLVGAAALLAQATLGAVVPMRRSSHESGNQDSNLPEQPTRQYNNQYNNNEYNNNNQYNNNQYNNNQYNNNQYNNQYEQQNNNENQYNNNNNQYEQQQQNQYETTSAAMAHETSAMAEEASSMEHETTSVESAAMAHETTSVESAMAHETTSVESAMAHETSSAVMAHETSSSEYAMPTYGSGANNWGNGYNDCVSQCMAQFGSPAQTMEMGAMPSATESASGAIHTVMVAPEGAGLRYVPFAVNASVGDTVRYVWTTNANHTATLSSSLAICNKSGIAEERNFVSGVRNAAQGMQTFDVVVETAEPQFFYCSVAQHCAKGMFGIINPGQGTGSSGNTVRSMMSSMLSSNPALEAAYRYMKNNITQGSPADDWGMNISLDGIPESAYADVAANVLYTQGTMAVNPGMLESEGASNPDGSPVKLLPDLNVLLSSTAASPSSPVGGGSATVTSDPSTLTPLTPANAADNGALSGKGINGVWITAVVGIAGWLLI